MGRGIKVELVVDHDQYVRSVGNTTGVKTETNFEVNFDFPANVHSDDIRSERGAANISGYVVVKAEPVEADISSSDVANINSDVIRTKPVIDSTGSDVIVKTETVSADDIISDVMRTKAVTWNISSDVIKTGPVSADDIISDVMRTKAVTEVMMMTAKTRDAA
ncbi:hypothetical protein ACOMHN_030094 [Nucella lapillus]